jgi:hypothetical protein
VRQKVTLPSLRRHCGLDTQSPISAVIAVNEANGSYSGVAIHSLVMQNEVKHLCLFLLFLQLFAYYFLFRKKVAFLLAM